jgi:hypothetical protein
MSEQTAEAVELLMRDELGRGDAMIATSRPILRHLLINDDHTLFSDEMIARIRGMMNHVAAQLLFAEAAAADALDHARYAAERQDALAQALFEDTELLAHAHALTLEARLTERLMGRSGIDAVLTPLVQELAAAKEMDVAGLAMAVLAAQARSMQHHRRMELPLGELPGDLFHKALLLLQDQGDEDEPEAERAAQQLREAYEEGASRLGLLARLVMTLGPKAARALAIDHAGVAIFATALAMASGQERGLTVLSFADRQFARLALALRAAGLQQQAVEEQFLYLHPETALPGGFGAVRADRAAALLASSRPQVAF